MGSAFRTCPAVTEAKLTMMREELTLIRNRRLTAIGFAVVSLTFAAASCGSDDDNSSDDTTAASVAPVETDAAETTVGSEKGMRSAPSSSARVTHG